MPLPLIPVAIGLGASALFGLYKGGKAVVDNSDAKNLNEESNNLISDYANKLDNARAVCQVSLEELGRGKFDALTGNIDHFLQVFSQIKNVEFSQYTSLNELKVAEFSNEILKELKQEVSVLKDGSLGLAGGAAAGAMTAFGAYSGTMALASAGTGTAISTLSGAAATNATLAWLGGGTLAGGGFGMAGGVLMVNALVAAPALAIMGWYMCNKAEKNLEEAKTNKAVAEKFVSDAEANITLIDGITDIALQLIELVSYLRKHCRRQTNSLTKIIESSGNDYSKYSDEEKAITFKTVKLIQLLKAVIDTPILDKDGNLLGDTASRITQLQKDVKEI